MKISNTVWTIIGIVVLIILLVIAWNQYQKNKANQDLANNQNSKTTQQEFCTKHGGTWDPVAQKCTAYAEPDVNRIAVVPIIRPFNPNNNPVGNGIPK